MQIGSHEGPFNYIPKGDKGKGEKRRLIGNGKKKKASQFSLGMEEFYRGERRESRTARCTDPKREGNDNTPRGGTEPQQGFIYVFYCITNEEESFLVSKGVDHMTGKKNRKKKN